MSFGLPESPNIPVVLCNLRFSWVFAPEHILQIVTVGRFFCFPSPSKRASDGTPLCTWKWTIASFIIGSIRCVYCRTACQTRCCTYYSRSSWSVCTGPHSLLASVPDLVAVLLVQSFACPPSASFSRHRVFTSSTQRVCSVSLTCQRQPLQPTAGV